MRGDNTPHSVYLERLAVENDAVAVRHKGDARDASASRQCRAADFEEFPTIFAIEEILTKRAKATRGFSREFAGSRIFLQICEGPAWRGGY